MTRAVAAALIGASLLSSGLQSQRPVFRAGADSVLVSVSVKRGNNAVPGLEAGDFRLHDNGVLQRIEALSIEAVPVDVSLFLDTSGSTAGALDEMKRAVQKIAAMLRPGDRFRLLTIGLSVYISIPWREAGESFELNMAPVAGISLIRDAVVAALLHPVSPGRRHLIVALTDGYDCGSLIEPNLVGDIAARSEAVLHWVAVERPGAVRPTGTFAWCPMNASYFDTGPLKEAVERSGGDLHRGGFRRADAVAAFSKVFEEFRQSYILHYSPEGVPGTGWHELRVEVPAGRYTVRARPGYFGR